jgi:hypothetical protein
LFRVIDIDAGRLSLRFANRLACAPRIWIAIKKDEDELPKMGGIPQTLLDRFGDVVNDLLQPRKPITKKGTPAREEADKREEWMQ